MRQICSMFPDVHVESAQLVNENGWADTWDFKLKFNNGNFTECRISPSLLDPDKVISAIIEYIKGITMQEVKYEC